VKKHGLQPCRKAPQQKPRPAGPPRMSQAGSTLLLSRCARPENIAIVKGHGFSGAAKCRNNPPQARQECCKLADSGPRRPLPFNQVNEFRICSHGHIITVQF
jgi:hypothetical protein